MLFGKRDKKEKPLLDLMGDVGTMGMHMVASTFVGMGIGWWLDKQFDTKPWLMVIFLVLGIVAGFKNMYDQATRMQKRNKHEENSTDGNSSKD